MCGGSGDVEDGRIWLRVRRGWSQWNGLVGDGALRPTKTELGGKYFNNHAIMFLKVHEQLCVT